MNLMTRIASFLLAIVLCTTWVAEASALRCESVFLPTISDIIQQLDSTHEKFLLKGSSFEDFSKDFSWMRKRKLRKLVSEVEIQNFPSEKAVERYAIELGTVLFGSKNTVDRWIFESKDVRLEESTVLIIKEKILKEGLLQTWGQSHDPHTVGLFRKMMDRIWIIQNSKVVQWARVPWNLPGLKDKEIPPDLMFKVMRDGFNNHSEEVRIALKTQTKIDAYNTFRKIYAPVVFGVLLIVNAHHGYHEIQAIHDRQVQEVVQQLQQTQKTVESSASQIKKEQVEIAYKSAVEDFIKKWGEPPTEAESQLIRIKIQQALEAS